jgi:SM-20-related protein
MRSPAPSPGIELALMIQAVALLIEQIANQGWAVSTDFLPAHDVCELRQEARILFDGGKFKRAGVGRSDRFKVRPEVRGDYIFWLDEQNPTPAQSRYFSQIEKLRLELNRELFTGLTEFEAHYAIYPPKTFYAKHVDRFSRADERSISSTLYLNESWRDTEGGALRLFINQKNHEMFTDIYPQAGTIVAFRSDLIYHEVRPSSRERYSITGWLKRRSLAGI